MALFSEVLNTPFSMAKMDDTLGDNVIEVIHDWKWKAKK